MVSADPPRARARGEGELNFRRMPTHQDDTRWFDAFGKGLQHQRLMERPIAYFCSEYALEPDMRTYAGGLGVLAGDVVREAGDRGVPMIAVGLYYREGYLCETPTDEGHQSGNCIRIAPEACGLEPALLPGGERLVVRVPIQDHDVHVQVWKWSKGNVPVYLLDTDLEANAPGDRSITHRLYVGDKETRLKQEIILGIGGLRAVEALDLHPSLYHLNEGHSAMLTLELIRHEMHERHIGFDEAKQFARRRVVLTNHTLVAAGQELFSNDLVSVLLAKYAEELQVPVSELVRLGLVQESSVFSMTMLAFRMSGVINAVSRLHARKAKETWTDHPMVAVTNGVHLPTWNRVGDDVSAPGALWTAHQARKRELLEAIRARTGRAWDEGHLLLGWARRLVGYKRPLAILEDAKRFAALARAAGREVRIVFGGTPHPADTDGAAMLKSLRDLVDGELKDVAAYVPEYGLDEAMLLVSGCDVWVNTPVVGFEACGTSVMKAALNGVLPFTTRDGWVDEIDLFGVGWPIDTERVTVDALDVLEKQIVPLYYDKNASGVPEAWESDMRNARALIRERFSATRMLRAYLETLYF